MSATSIQLKELLSEKLTTLGAGLNGIKRSRSDVWSLNFSAFNPAWPDHLTKGALTEIVCSGNNSGSAQLIHALVNRAAAEKFIVGMIDGSDSLDVVSMDKRGLSRLLWVRCHSVAEALKATDHLLRDRNFSLVVLDLKLNNEAELRKIPATTWYRLQRLIERTSTVCVIFTPRLLVGATRERRVLPAKIENSIFNS